MVSDYISMEECWEMPTSAEIRARARQSLQGIWGRTIGYLLLFYLVLGVPLGLISLISIVGEVN